MTFAFSGEVFRFSSTGQYVLCRGPVRAFDGDARLLWEPIPAGTPFAASRIPAELQDAVPDHVREAITVRRYWGP